ncbi:MAG: hypothetical protein GQ564_18895 [Bacteroidales bacterium]|nr:hypothetical protein [Bacteroidales bacterium]
MKKIILLILCVFFFNLSYSISPGESNNALLLNISNKTEVNINNNYQQFKYQVVNFETTNNIDYSYLKKKRRKKKKDNLMLYVAGGLAVATATLILTNDPENFTSNSASSVNLGIAVGGTLASGMIVTKHFFDKNR